jgi:deoxyribonuclease-1
MDKPEVVNTIVGVIRSYDIVAVQEISDISGHTPTRLLEAINVVDDDYGMSISPRSGQQPDDASRAEQYGFYYRRDLYELMGEQLYNDFQHDYFSREPWIARFRHIETGVTFLLITIHTVPTETVAEINSLHQVVMSISSLWPEEQNIVLLGDMNAGCHYATPEQLEQTSMAAPNYFWVVPHTADTNLAASVCAYDRIILSNYFQNFYTGHWGVSYSIDKSVSDHWPVWFELDL